MSTNENGISQKSILEWTVEIVVAKLAESTRPVPICADETIDFIKKVHATLTELSNQDAQG